ncbi:MAG TPA: hypothetical protein VED66_16230 [Candidatus Sulfotelmatobacter sp.]|nr:hypothetical protein [Candidatus Sulfotelmatobacter sp.]
MIRQDFALIQRADGSNLEFEDASVQGDRACLNRENSLVQAVQGGVQITMGIPGKMKHKMELCIAGLKRASVGAFQRGRRLGVKKNCSRKETKAEE